ncbi:hypothetical protein CRH09_32840 [Nocardia terpenica]|uniref:MarR family transcriptional regulator n=1 Tax=Nocardia terpenica TaxID=455432 RepID=A0A291RS06_9NOCA|nr:hypothetical protein CRH09_32840 [Nocardia terpenica]
MASAHPFGGTKERTGMGTAMAAESAVLGVLAPGGLLSANQITAQAQLTSWSARRAIRQLSARGLIMHAPYQARWSITQRGQQVWSIKHRRFAE